MSTVGVNLALILFLPPFFPDGKTSSNNAIASLCIRTGGRSWRWIVINPSIPRSMQWQLINLSSKRGMEQLLNISVPFALQKNPVS